MHRQQLQGFRLFAAVLAQGGLAAWLLWACIVCAGALFAPGIQKLYVPLCWTLACLFVALTETTLPVPPSWRQRVFAALAIATFLALVRIGGTP